MLPGLLCNPDGNLLGRRASNYQAGVHEHCPVTGSGHAQGLHLENRHRLGRGPDDRLVRIAERTCWIDYRIGQSHNCRK
jgi:hypothetical protein